MAPIMRRSVAALLGLFLVNCLLAQAGWFNRAGSWLLILATFVCGTIALLHFGNSLAFSLKFGPGTRPIPWLSERWLPGALVCGLLLCFGLQIGCYYNPSDRVFGACDEGLYANTAVNLAKTGHYYLDAPILSEASGAEKALLLKSEPAAAQRGTKLRQVHPRYHIGLFVRDSNGAQLTPQFPLGWPAILAASYSVGGWHAAQAANTGITFLCAVFVGILALGWLGPVTALSAFVIFLFFPLHPWAARSIFSEPALEFAWLLTVFGWRESKSDPLWGGIITGLAAGAMLCLKIEASLVVAGMAGLWAWHWMDRPRFVLASAAASLVSLAVAGSAWRQFNQFYLADTFGSVPHQLLWGAAAALLMVAAILARPEVQLFVRGQLRTARVKSNPPVPTSSSRVNLWRVIKVIAFFALILLAYYGAFIRPEPATPDSYFYWPVQQQIRSFREDTFVRLIWYWQPWGLALAVLGAASMVFKLRKPWQIGLYGVGLFFLIGLSYDIRNNPIQPYAMRRYLPFATPILVIGAAYIGRALVRQWVSRRFYKEWIPVVVQIAVTVTLLAGFVPINRLLNQHVEFAGVPAHVEKLASEVPENALVLVSEASGLSWLATPLQFMYGRQCMIVPAPLFKDAGFPDLVERWTKNGHAVYLITEIGGVRWYAHGAAQVFNPTSYENLTTSYLFQSPSERPKDIRTFSLRYHLIPLR